MEKENKEKAFLEELKALMKKYKVQIRSYDDYNGNDDYCGSNFYFEGDGINIEIKDIEA